MAASDLMPALHAGLVSVSCYCTSLRNFLQHQVSRLHPRRQHFGLCEPSQPSTRAPAAIFFTQHITSWAAIAALPRACSPHRLVKINFYSINFFDGSALTLFNTRSCHIIRCAHHVKFNSLQSFLQPQTFEPTLRRQHFASLRDTRNPRLRVC